MAAAALAALEIQAIDSMESESMTNGVWLHLLSQAFPFPTYIIAPEHRSSTPNRVDLFVIRVRDNKPVFAFEGKQALPAGNVNLQPYAGQIIAYLKDIKGGRGYGFGVIAAGPLYAIMQYDGSNTLVRTKAIGNPMALGMGTDGKLTAPSVLRAPADLLAVVVALRSIELWIEREVR